MEAMRDVLRGTLGASLRGIDDEDRLAAAWTVACGSAMAGRGRVAGYEDGVVRVEVTDQVWLRQMTSLSSTLERELGKISGLRVKEIRFYTKQAGKSASQQVSGSNPRRRRNGE